MRLAATFTTRSNSLYTTVIVAPFRYKTQVLYLYLSSANAGSVCYRLFQHTHNFSHHLARRDVQALHSIGTPEVVAGRAIRRPAQQPRRRVAGPPLALVLG